MHDWPHLAHLLPQPVQINLADAVRRNISLSAGGKTYRLNDKVAVMLVRPRG